MPRALLPTVDDPQQNKGCTLQASGALPPWVRQYCPKGVVPHVFMLVCEALARKHGTSPAFEAAKKAAKLTKEKRQ